MENNADGLMNRAEIDTSAPFASVKEAVMKFGEKVLVKELYANMITQMRTTNMNVENHSIRGPSNAEVDETKNKLTKSHQDNKIIENRLAYLEKELEKTKTELIHIKAKEANRQFIESDVEHLKFVENESEVEIKINNSSQIANANRTELQKKRSVKFAEPPIVTHNTKMHEHVPERQYFVNTESMHEKERKRKSHKKKRLMPLLAAIFSKKKNNYDGVAYA